MAQQSSPLLSNADAQTTLSEKLVYVTPHCLQGRWSLDLPSAMIVVKDKESPYFEEATEVLRAGRQFWIYS